MRDLMDELAAVERRVAEGEVPAGPAHVVALARTYRAPRADVWDALTEPDRLARWFLPVSGDLVLGGATSSRATPAASCGSARGRTGWW